MTEISGMVCVLRIRTVLLHGNVSTSRTASGISPLAALSSPFIPHYIKPSHTASPAGSLSPTHARKSSSIWKQLFGQSCTGCLGYALPELYARALLPTRTPTLLNQEPFTILMVTLTPLSVSFA